MIFFYRLSCLVVIRGISKGNPIKINCLLIIYKLQNILVYCGTHKFTLVKEAEIASVIVAAHFEELRNHDLDY